MSENLLIALESANSKLGNVVATYRQVGPTCPSTCSLLNKGCYAQRGFSAFQSVKSTERNDNFNKILEGKRRLIRHHVTGDCFKDNKLDIEYLNSLIAFHKKNEEYNGWLYTHRIQDWDNAGFTANIIPKNLQVIASCDTEDDIKYAKANNWKYARVTEDHKTLAKDECWCPVDKLKAEYKKYSNEVKVNCETCKLCFDKEYYNLNIVFQKHNGKPQKNK